VQRCHLDDLVGERQHAVVVGGDDDEREPTQVFFSHV